MNTYRELLLGCGHARDKRMDPTMGAHQKWEGLVTLDHNPRCKPDVLCDLNQPFDVWEFGRWDERLDSIVDCMIENCGYFKQDSFDEVHAYEVLEHLGQQGDAFAFFAHFSEIWRILKPGGFLCATVPSRYSPWLWGDPSHRRLINLESLAFLDQTNYAQCDGPRPSTMSDFRDIYKADFKLREQQDNHKQFVFILEAVKPARLTVTQGPNP